MYTIRFYHGESKERQLQANCDKCNAYLAARYNYSNNPDDNFTIVAVGSNATNISKRWGRFTAKLISSEFETPLGSKDGILTGGINGRNEYDLVYANMPAIFIEPLFATNPFHAIWIRNKAAQLRMARILVNSIYKLFPNGGTIGFSVNPQEILEISNEYFPGLHGGGNPDQYIETVLRQAAIMMQSQHEPSMLFGSESIPYQ